jgi:hypothetical protein
MVLKGLQIGQASHKFTMNSTSLSLTATKIETSIPFPLERYVLDSCLEEFPSTNPSSVLGSLRTENRQGLICDSSGLRLSAESTTPLESSFNVAELQKRVAQASMGWSASVWITPPSTSTEDGPRVIDPFLTLGLSSTLAGSTISLEGTCTGFYFQMGLIQGHLVLQFQDTDPARSCRTVVVNKMSLSGKTHVATTVGTSSSSIYVNGQAVFNLPFGPDATMAGWTRATQSTMQLFATNPASRVFQGAIRQVTFYSEELTEDQIAEEFQLGVGPASSTFIELVARASVEALLIPQDQSTGTRFWIGGFNASSTTLPLAVEILSFPIRGLVFLVGEEEVVVLVDAIAANATKILPLSANFTGFFLEYRLTESSDYFSVPSTNVEGEFLEMAVESLIFRTIAVETKESLVASSQPITILINVQHVNHRPEWNAPKSATVSVIAGLPVVRVGTIQLVDQLDRNTDRVRIDISTSNGQLTLDPLYAGLADFGSCSSRIFSDWQCQGNGVGDRLMTFVAVPEDIEGILSNLNYTSLGLLGASDEIVLTAYDGAGGSCLDPREHASSLDPSAPMTLHRGCFQVRTIIRIPAVLNLLDASKRKEKGILGIPNTDLKQFGTADLMFWAVVMFSLMSVCVCLRQCPNCLARGAAVVPDDNEAEEDDFISSVEIGGEAVGEAAGLRPNEDDTPDAEHNVDDRLRPKQE